MLSDSGQVVDRGSLPAGVHFIMIGAYELQPQPAPYTSTNMLISAAQIAWITADLAAVDRSVTPWIVAMFHPREPFPAHQERKTLKHAQVALICHLHHAACSTGLAICRGVALLKAASAHSALEQRLLTCLLLFWL